MIPSNSDRGVMAILDTRLHSKFYGKRILSCLPPARRVFTLEEVQHFFTPLGEEIQQLHHIRTILLEQGQGRHTYLKQMTNGEIIQKMQQIIEDENRTEYQLTWLRKGLNLILEKIETKK